MEDQTYNVKLYIYDLSKGLARQLSPILLGKQLEGVWHTSIIIHGAEYFYGGQGITHCPPGATLLGEPDAIVDLGNTEVPKDIFTEYISSLHESTFRPETYHLFEHNCNTFSSEMAQFLTGRKIPSYITDLPADVLSTPFGQTLRPLIESVTIVPPTDNSFNGRYGQRTLQELLKQPGGNVSPGDVTVSSRSTIGDNGISARMLRSHSEQYHLSNTAFSPTVRSSHPQSNNSLPGLTHKYSSLKAVADTASRGYYKSYPLMDFSLYQTVPAPFQPIPLQQKDKSCFHQDKPYVHQALPSHDVLSDLSISIPTRQFERSCFRKTIAHPLHLSSSFTVGDSAPRHVHRQTSHPGHPGRRQTYASRRQYSTEMLPELFTQPMSYEGASPYPHKHKSFQTNSKTEVTV